MIDHWWIDTDKKKSYNEPSECRGKILDCCRENNIGKKGNIRRKKIIN